MFKEQAVSKVMKMAQDSVKHSTKKLNDQLDEMIDISNENFTEVDERLKLIEEKLDKICKKLDV
jgi:tRNA(Phe) wybutosine-synthesizing methylase Tyw3